MRTLIRLFSEALARVIEAGSLWGALFGAIVGTALAWVGAYLLRQADLLDRYWIGAAIAGTVVLAIGCAIAGSRLFPRDLPAKGDDVLLTNLNHALCPPAFLLGVIAFLTLWMADEYGKHRQFDWRQPGVWIGIAFAVILALISFRMILAVRVGREVVWYRVWGTRRFDRSAIVDWGFEVAPHRYSTFPPPHVASFEIKVAGYPAFRKDVSPRMAERLAASLVEAKTLSRLKPTEHQIRRV